MSNREQDWYVPNIRVPVKMAIEIQFVFTHLFPIPVVNFEFMSAKTAEMQSDWFTDFEPQLSFLP